MEHPLLPVKKAGGDDYRPVQDLRAVNNAIITLHPVVPNPYTPEPSIGHKQAGLLAWT
jgi:hypothetical protein